MKSWNVAILFQTGTTKRWAEGRTRHQFGGKDLTQQNSRLHKKVIAGPRNFWHFWLQRISAKNKSTTGHLWPDFMKLASIFYMDQSSVWFWFVFFVCHFSANPTNQPAVPTNQSNTNMVPRRSWVVSVKRKRVAKSGSLKTVGKGGDFCLWKEEIW